MAQQTNNQQAKEYLSQEKYKEIEEELKDLRTVQRREVADQLEYAKSLGDLSENAEYQEARDEQARIEDRISYLEQLLKHAEVVSEHSTNVVTVGSDVELLKKGSDKPQTFTVVGVEEASTEHNRISTKSPIGEAIYGKKKGDTVVVQTPSGEKTYTIKKIS